MQSEIIFTFELYWNLNLLFTLLQLIKTVKGISKISYSLWGHIQNIHHILCFFFSLGLYRVCSHALWSVWQKAAGSQRPSKERTDTVCSVGTQEGDASSQLFNAKLCQVPNQCTGKGMMMVYFDWLFDPCFNYSFQITAFPKKKTTLFHFVYFHFQQNK